MIAQLVPVRGGGQPITISKDIVVVGRDADCEIRFRDKSISKYHCVLVKTDGLILLRDLNSTNGCRVNKTKVKQAALLPNDFVSFANFHFKVHLGPDAVVRQPEGQVDVSLRDVFPPDSSTSL